MKEFLSQLNINNPGTLTDDDEYVVEIPDSNEYSRIFSKIENSDIVREVEDDSVFDIDNNTLYFESEDYELELNADLENDVYSLVVRKKLED